MLAAVVIGVKLGFNSLQVQILLKNHPV